MKKHTRLFSHRRYRYALVALVTALSTLISLSTPVGTHRAQVQFAPPTQLPTPTPNTLGPPYGVLTVAFSHPDGKLIASGGSDGKIRLSDARAGQIISVSESSTGRSVKGDRLPAVHQVSFNPQGNFFEAALANGSILFFDRNGKLQKSIEAHRDSVLWTVFTDSTPEFISVGKDSTVRLWKLDRL